MYNLIETQNCVIENRDSTDSYSDSLFNGIRETNITRIRSESSVWMKPENL